MQGSARKDVVFGAARVYTVAVPGSKWKSWLKTEIFSSEFKADSAYYFPPLHPESLTDGIQRHRPCF